MDTSIAPGGGRTPEIEAKFLIRGEDRFRKILATLESCGYRVNERYKTRQTDRYFDTRDWRILRSGWAFRCRENRDEAKLMLKSLGTRSGAVFTREEIEQPLPGGVLRKKQELPAGLVQEVLRAVCDGKRFREIFCVKTCRTGFDVHAPGEGGAAIELDFDQTRIKAPKANLKAPGKLEFMEVEFETDDEETAQALADLLHEQRSLIPSRFSKFERGLQAAGLSRDEIDAAPHGKPPRPKQSILNLVYFYLEGQLDALKIQRPRAWEGIDPEGVHRMRVAIRRTRTILREFRKALPRAGRDHLDRELRWLLKILGHVRDADVCELAIEHYRAGLQGDPEHVLEPFESHLRSTTLGAQLELVTALAGERYAGLINHFEQFVESRGASNKPGKLRDASIAECEYRLVHKVFAKMLKRARRISGESPARQIHKLRLLAKRMRYLLEFFSVSRPRRWRAPIAALVVMQDELGEHQDAIVAQERLTTFAENLSSADANRELLIAIGRLAQQEEDRALEYRGRLPELWARFEESISPIL